MTNQHQQTWEAYVGAWRSTSATEKRQALQRAVAENAEYRDPLTEAKGHEALIGYMTEFHRQAPGVYFSTHSFLAHHDRSIAKWNMVDAKGTVVGEGVSYGQYGSDGKLVAMTGFFDVPNREP